MISDIGGIPLGDNRVHFIAEISNNHNGNLKLAHRLIDGAKAAGASFVKGQCYSPDELVALRGDGPAPAQWGEQGWLMRQLYEKARTPFAWFPELMRQAKALDIPFFASVFGLESLAVMDALDAPAFKIARLDNGSDKLRKHLAVTGKPVLISANDAAGIDCTEREMKLWCPEGYPQMSLNLSPYRFERFTKRAGSGYSGFSYHGTDITPCLVAAMAGAQIIEVHVQLDDERSELEGNISLTISQLSELVTRTREMEVWRK